MSTFIRNAAVFIFKLIFGLIRLVFNILRGLIVCFFEWLHHHLKRGTLGQEISNIIGFFIKVFAGFLFVVGVLLLISQIAVLYPIGIVFSAGLMATSIYMFKAASA